MFLQPVNLTASTLTLTQHHAGAVVTVNRAAGSTITLPAASGTGRYWMIYVGTTITSNNLVVQVANSTDIFSGVAYMATDNASDVVIAFETGASDDTATMNGTTKGGIKGDFIEIRDVASGIFHIRISGSATGTEVTMFSAAV